jgi:hypothetical protein
VTEIDVCCGAFVGRRVRTVCQLYVGHEGNHASVLSNDGRRVLRRWSSPLSAEDAPFAASLAAGLPWAPGKPAVDPAKPALSLVSPDEPMSSSKPGDLEAAS